MEIERFLSTIGPAFRIKVDGQTYSYLDYCPHKGRVITSEGFLIVDGRIRCPFHGAEFDIKSGELKVLPVSKTPCPPNCRLIPAV